MMRLLNVGRAALAGLALSGLTLGAVVPAQAAGEIIKIERQKWSWSGMFGRFDAAQLQRGFQVYKENCAACHTLNRVYYRNLTEPGGPQFDAERIQLLASEAQVRDGPNDDGEMFDRPARLSDRYVGPFKNEKEARAANNGAYPPDFSLIIKARSAPQDHPWYIAPFFWARDIATGYEEGGADYMYALLTSYKEEPPAYTRSPDGKLIPVAKGAEIDDDKVERCVKVVPGEVGDDGKRKPDTCNKLGEGMYYNASYPGHQIAMPAPLSKDVFVEYQNAKASMAQNARDVTAFLAWASDPRLEERKQLGLSVMIYLLIMTILLYFAKRAIWARVKH
ncbi:MAG: cytochrome c1 [Pseudomonadota bacterium]